jgi:hypothetical protein
VEGRADISLLMRSGSECKAKERGCTELMNGSRL